MKHLKEIHYRREAMKGHDTGINAEEIERAKQFPYDELHVFGQRRGKIRTGLCPFHKEKTGSFTLYDDNTVHCFGCGWHGDTIDFVMEKDGRTFAEAVRRLQ
jgi:hypothetical protein